MFFKSKIKPAKLILHDGESSVDSSLAMTPSQMARLTSQGRAVSMASLEGQSYYCNERDYSDMNIEFQRGIDLNQVWLASKQSKQKIDSFNKRSVNTKSDGNQLKQ